jgi:Secretion system C-terminal sorting domain
MKKLMFSVTFWFLSFYGFAQVIYGINNYTQYHAGSLPIIISVPHGGLIAPSDIPDRTCNDPTIVTDSKTIELARQIDTALFNLTGCHPHLIICNLRRTKVDCNRNIADGACGNNQAGVAWTEFQDFIKQAQFLSNVKFQHKAIYIDLHGHGKPIKRLELGYGLTGNMLRSTDSELNNPTIIANSSSIERLVANNVNGYTHAELIRGPTALGSLLGNAGFPSVPSQQYPDPGATDYFSGGYNTFNHTCILPGNSFDGLQIECDQSVRLNDLSRKVFADSTASILIRYLSIHHNIHLNTNCGLTTTVTEIINDDNISFEIIPNPASDFVTLRIDEIKGSFEVIIINQFGEIVLQTKNQSQLSVSSLPKGIYFVKVIDIYNNECIKKLIVI